LLVSGVLFLLLLIAIKQAGYFDGYLLKQSPTSLPDDGDEAVTREDIPTPRWNSPEERLAELASEGATTSPTSEERERRAEEVEAAQAETDDSNAAKMPVRSIEERLREVEEQSREI
jgi:nitric oxide reductase activation protein